MNYNDELKKILLDNGIDLFGVADLSSFKNDFVQNLLKKGLNRGIVIGYRLSKAILDEIEDHPTPEYYHHYRQVNMLLDQVGLKLTSFIQRKGFQSFPIPASQIVDWEKQKGILSHKHLGVLAGLGFIGRNNLLVNLDYGAQFRITSILTDIPLETNKPISLDCGECTRCINVCPANAISLKREEFNHIACFEKLKEFVKKKYTGQYICGICVKVCDGSNFR
uniref:Epoxyqueuosine reductase n=1 Tax=candidate division WOR-3 bacterium TaxID=2052148 RepID=A0A7C4UCU0_UNCW3